MSFFSVSLGEVSTQPVLDKYLAAIKGIIGDYFPAFPDHLASESSLLRVWWYSCFSWYCKYLTLWQFSNSFALLDFSTHFFTANLWNILTFIYIMKILIIFLIADYVWVIFWKETFLLNWIWWCFII